MLAALLAQRWRPVPRDARAIAVCGGLCVLFVLGWGDLVHRYLYKSGMYGLCVATCLLLFAFRSQPATAPRGLRWLARTGILSYELYLSHMFVVLGVVTIYRRLFGSEQVWTFAVYLPVLAVCFFIARLLERLLRQQQ